MIAVQLNKRDFEYDIHSLIRAFYPGMDVPVYQEGEAEPEGWEKKLVVDYQSDQISLELVGKKNEILGKAQRDVDYEADRKATKNVLKSMLYEMLRDHTGQSLPWGNLTGIRPTKIPMALLEQGWKNTEIADYMRKTYYTSNEKTELSIMIANRERHILKDINYEDGYSLYV